MALHVCFRCHVVQVKCPVGQNCTLVNCTDLCARQEPGGVGADLQVVCHDGEGACVFSSPCFAECSGWSVPQSCRPVAPLAQSEVGTCHPVDYNVSDTPVRCCHPEGCHGFCLQSLYTESDQANATDKVRCHTHLPHVPPPPPGGPRRCDPYERVDHDVGYPAPAWCRRGRVGRAAARCSVLLKATYDFTGTPTGPPHSTPTCMPQSATTT